MTAGAAVAQRKVAEIVTACAARGMPAGAYFAHAWEMWTASSAFLQAALEASFANQFAGSGIVYGSLGAAWRPTPGRAPGCGQRGGQPRRPVARRLPRPAVDARPAAARPARLGWREHMGLAVLRLSRRGRRPGRPVHHPTADPRCRLRMPLAERGERRQPFLAQRPDDRRCPRCGCRGTLHLPVWGSVRCAGWGMPR